MATNKTVKRNTRHARIRAKVKGTAERPRLSVFRSNVYIYAQLIDDDKGVTLAAATSKGKKVRGLPAALEVGKAIAEAGKAKKIEKVVFDRGGFIYTGAVKALAEEARKGGLEF